MEPLNPPDQLFIRIDDCLERLLDRSRGVCVLLADISGQLITEKGKDAGLDTTALAAVTASNMAATGEMARQIGEPTSFSDELSQVGLVRIFARLAVNELQQVAAELEPWLRRVSSVVDREFGGALAEGLDEAFI